MTILDHERFMKMALEEAHIGEAAGNPPVGSVIVKQGEVIARGHNTAGPDLDITAHAETVALRNAGPVLGHMDLSGCILYSTGEPCLMCAGAIVFAGVSAVVLGGNYSRRFSAQDQGDYSVEKVFALVDRSDTEVIRGILTGECEAMRRSHRSK